MKLLIFKNFIQEVKQENIKGDTSKAKQYPPSEDLPFFNYNNGNCEIKSSHDALGITDNYLSGLNRNSRYDILKRKENNKFIVLENKTHASKEYSTVQHSTVEIGVRIYTGDSKNENCVIVCTEANLAFNLNLNEKLPDNVKLVTDEMSGDFTIKKHFAESEKYFKKLVSKAKLNTKIMYSDSLSENHKHTLFLTHIIKKIILKEEITELEVDTINVLSSFYDEDKNVDVIEFNKNLKFIIDEYKKDRDGSI